jgi:hypothetical protein
MYSFGAPIFQPEKVHHKSLLLLLHLSSITYFINHKNWERFVSFCDFLSGNFYNSLSGMVLPDDTIKWHRHEIECAWRQQGRVTFFTPCKSANNCGPTVGNQVTQISLRIRFQPSSIHRSDHLYVCLKMYLMDDSHSRYESRVWICGQISSCTHKRSAISVDDRAWFVLRMLYLRYGSVSFFWVSGRGIYPPTLRILWFITDVRIFLDVSHSTCKVGLVAQSRQSRTTLSMVT